MADVRWRYATAADIPPFFGGPIPFTVRAAVVEVDGAHAALIGLVSDGLGAQCFFSEEMPAFEPHRGKIPTMRALQRVMRWARESTVPVYSVSNNHSLLKRLGFEQLDQDLFVCRG